MVTSIESFLFVILQWFVSLREASCDPADGRPSEVRVRVAGDPENHETPGGLHSEGQMAHQRNLRVESDAELLEVQAVEFEGSFPASRVVVRRLFDVLRRQRRLSLQTRSG